MGGDDARERGASGSEALQDFERVVGVTLRG
jgi:hypothetical protein